MAFPIIPDEAVSSQNAQAKFFSPSPALIEIKIHWTTKHLSSLLVSKFGLPD